MTARKAGVLISWSLVCVALGYAVATKAADVSARGTAAALARMVNAVGSIDTVRSVAVSGSEVLVASRRVAVLTHVTTIRAKGTHPDSVVIWSGQWDNDSMAARASADTALVGTLGVAPANGGVVVTLEPARPVSMRIVGYLWLLPLARGILVYGR